MILFLFFYWVEGAESQVLEIVNEGFGILARLKWLGVKSSNLLPDPLFVWNTALIRHEKNDTAFFFPIGLYFFNCETLLNNLLLNVYPYYSSRSIFNLHLENIYTDGNVSALKAWLIVHNEISKNIVSYSSVALSTREVKTQSILENHPWCSNMPW